MFLFQHLSRRNCQDILIELLGVVSFEVDGIKYYANAETGQASVWMNYDSSITSIYTGSIIIPETVEYDGITYTVTSIGPNAFSGSTITDITIPQTVTTFASYAFDDCYNMIEFAIPDYVKTINDYAFASSKIKGVVLDCGSIGTHAFDSCTNLSEVTFLDNVKDIGAYAFSGCTSLKELSLNAVAGIGDNAFQSCTHLTAVDTGNAVTTIGEYAFNKCSALTEVTIGQSVSNIGTSAFEECGNLMSITSLNATPPSCESYAFLGVSKNNCTIYVPTGAKSAYVSADTWQDFSNIVEME